MPSLKKGALYAGILDGRLSFGYYVGLAPGWYVFEEAPFTFTHEDLSKGVKQEDIGKWHFIEVPSLPVWCKSDVLSYVQERLK